MSTNFRFQQSIRVRYSEIDGQMIVFNSHYLTYFDVALTEYMRQLGLVFLAGYNEPQFDYALVATSIRFYTPAFFDNIIDVYVRVSDIGTTSFKAEFLIENQNTGKRIVTGETVYVGYDTTIKSKISVPDNVRNKIERFELDGSVG